MKVRNDKLKFAIRGGIRSQGKGPKNKGASKLALKSRL
jgi:hypothetical protein